MENKLKETIKVTIKDTVEQGVYKEGQKVQLVVKNRTDLGYKAVIEGKYWGVLYTNEIFTELRRNQEVDGYIKKIREDGRIDLSLYATGTKESDQIAEKILAELKKSKGYLEFNDKVSAEIIYDLFGVSKKKFKIALGGLYKKRIVDVRPDGIYLVKKNESKKY